MTELSHTVLKKAADCFKEARKNVYAGAALLYEIDQQNLWEGRYSSFYEYVEQECQLSKGYVSKLLQVWKFYVIDRGATTRSLEGVDAEKLYLASKLPADSFAGKDLVTIAREWNRDDFRAELSTTDGVECQHPEESRVILCGKCHSRVG